MFQHQGVWLPDAEKHFPEWMTKNGEVIDGKGTYQIKKLRVALEHCKQYRTAIDVGAHVGLWSMQLAKRFQTIHAFEPVEIFRECWWMNMHGIDIGILYPMALGAEAGSVKMIIPALNGGLDTGGTHVAPKGANVVLGRVVEMRALDEFDFSDVDFIKIDCEGYEQHVIEGARETLIRCRPCVIVEQKPHKLGPNFGIKGTPAVDALKALGAEVRTVLSGDYVMTWST